MSSGHEASGPEASRPGSGVLARMIQRSREPQSSLEPVIQPRFAPRAAAFAPGDDPAPGSPPPGARPAEAPSPAAPAPQALAPSAPPPEALSPDVPAPEAVSPDELPPETPVAVIPDLPETSRVTGSGNRSPQLSPWPVTATPAEDDFASRDEPAPLDPGPPSYRARAASERAVTSRAAHREYRSEQRSYRSVVAVAGEEVREVGAREPAVTITIGHIEVRAAPAPQRPPRPPRQEAPQRPKPAFRPQTTLADFLGNGAGGSGRR
jgi:hypothetical protein